MKSPEGRVGILIRASDPPPSRRAFLGRDVPGVPVGSLPRPDSLPRPPQVFLPFPPPGLAPVPPEETSPEGAASSTHQPAAEVPGAGRAKNRSAGQERSGAAGFRRRDAFRGCQDTSCARSRPPPSAPRAPALRPAPGSREERRYPPPATRAGGAGRDLWESCSVFPDFFFFFFKLWFFSRRILLLELQPLVAVKDGPRTELADACS